MVKRNNYNIKYIIYFIVLFLSGCQFVNDNSWKEVGIVPINHHINSITSDKNDVFVAGYFSDQKDILSGNINLIRYKRDAIIFKKTNNSTLKRIFHGKGEIISINIDKNKIYALGIMYLMNGGFKSYVVISVDNGNNWIELSGAPSDLIGFDFSSDRGFYCWSKDHLYFSLNEGKDWAIANIVDYRKILNRVSPIIDKDNGIWLAFKDKIVCFNLNGTSDIYPLEHGFEVLSMAQNLEGNKYILVRDAGISMIRILVLSLSSQFVPIKEMPDVYVWNFSLLDPGFVILAADKVKDNSNFLILGENFEEPLRKVEPPSKYLLSGELLTVNDSGHLLLMTNSGRLLEVNLRE